MKMNSPVDKKIIPSTNNQNSTCAKDIIPDIQNLNSPNTVDITGFQVSRI
jgi:hypothetical protein